MNRIRLLPVVVFAGLALLLFKSVALITSGGYVLTGVDTVMAAGGGGGHGAPADAHGAPAGGGADGALASERTLTDRAPTLTDKAPTLVQAGAGGGHGAPSGHGEAPADAGGHGAPAETEPAATEAQPCRETAPNGAANDGGECIELAGGGSTTAQLSPTERTLLQRLGERRTELDTREAELDLRASLVEAAEKRLDEGRTELATIERRIAALTEQQKADQDAQIKSLAGMYEAMRPGDAAKIFDTLDGETLLKLTRVMNPRKMSPILAKMDAQRAQALTTSLATGATKEAETAEADPLAGLPQIRPQ